MNNELNQIDQQIAELLAKKQSLISSQRQEALQKAKELITQFSFTANDLGLDKKRKTKAEAPKVTPKYRNPANPEQTWAGRGRAPLWIQELQKAGAIDSALIK